MQTLSGAVCGQWGVRRQATGLGGRQSLPEPLDHFYSCPMTATHKVWAAQATSPHVWQGPGTTSALHRPVAQLRSPAARCRAQGTRPSSGSLALVGILALPHATGWGCCTSWHKCCFLESKVWILCSLTCCCCGIKATVSVLQLLWVLFLKNHPYSGTSGGSVNIQCITSLLTSLFTFFPSE